MFVKLTSGFAGIPLVSRNLVLQELWRTGSKSCKLEVTFAIYLGEILRAVFSFLQKQYSRLREIFLKIVLYVI